MKVIPEGGLPGDERQTELYATFQKDIRTRFVVQANQADLEYLFEIKSLVSLNGVMGVPENMESMGKGTWPFLMSNIYWIQLLGVQALASRPHSKLRAFTLLDGASTSLHALYIAERKENERERHTNEEMTLPQLKRR